MATRQQARGFRPEIQALRALAVTLVLVYHLWPRYLPGGFIGVDVFFVISGYLITAHLLREVTRTGSVKLTWFWARRARRLLPASLTVLLVSFIAMLIWLPKSLWQQTSEAIGASALYVVNWLLASNATNYLAADREPSIVQHYWSLSVEEQFYIVWPLLFLLALALLGRGSKKVAAIRTAVIAVAVASFVFSVIFTAVDPSPAYFATPTRAWEFAAGGLLAFVPSATRALTRGLASWVGLALIGVSAFVLTGDGFPGFIAILPVAGAALVIWAGDVGTRWAPTVIAGWRPIQVVGDLSYSIYLWHWPLIVLYPYVVDHGLGNRGRLVIIALTLALAFLSYRFVEQPVRQSAYWGTGRRRAFTLTAAGMAVIVGATAFTTVATQRSYDLTAAPTTPFTSTEEIGEQVDATLQLSAWPDADQPHGDDAQAPEWIKDHCITIHEDDLDRCSYGEPDADRVAAVIGDSFATAMLPAIRGALEPNGWRVQVLTMGQCPISDVAVRSVGVKTEFTTCPPHREWVYDYLEKTQPDLIIGVSSSVSTIIRLMSGNDGSAALAEWSAGNKASFAKLAALDIPTVIIGGPPRVNCGPDEAPDSCKPLPELPEAKNIASEKKDALAAGLNFVDTSWWVCSPATNLCPDQIGAALVRADTGHLAGTYSKRLSLLMEDALAEVTPLAPR